MTGQLSWLECGIEEPTASSMQASLTSSELAQRRAAEGAQRGEQRCRAGRSAVVEWQAGFWRRRSEQWREAGKEPLGLSKVIGTSKSDQIRPWLTVQEAGSAQPYLYTVAVAVRRKGC